MGKEHVPATLPPLMTLDGDQGTPKFNHSHYLNAFLATGFFRIWGALIFMAGWATMVVCIQKFVWKPFVIPSTLITVLGTVLGFVISYRTSSAYERWAEGRKLWSNIVVSSRIWARTVWICNPDSMMKVPPEDPAEREADACRAVLEKVTILNLVQAFGVSLKHYLRGEEGVGYEDLWPLVRHLPGYNLPNSIPTPTEARGPNPFSQQAEKALNAPLPYLAPRTSQDQQRRSQESARLNQTRSGSSNGGSKEDVSHSPRSHGTTLQNLSGSSKPDGHGPTITIDTGDETLRERGPGPVRRQMTMDDPPLLKPSTRVRKQRLGSIWPLSLLSSGGGSGEAVIGARERSAQRERARKGQISNNVPLEVSLYMTAYILNMAKRDTIDLANRNVLINSLNVLVDSLTGLERILTTPIPFSYSAHIWTTAWLYVILLPFQIVSTFGWVTIPATVLISFVFLAFLTIGEEIENPFGYDRNDLDLDLFNNIVRAEFAAIMSRPMPDPAEWIFVSSNSSLFGEAGTSSSALQLEKQGLRAVRHALATQGGVSAEQWEARVQTDTALLSPGGEGMRKRDVKDNGMKKEAGAGVGVSGGGDREMHGHDE